MEKIMKKTITLTSKPLCAEAFNGKGVQSIVEASQATVTAISELLFELVPILKIEFLNRVDEETPCNSDRFQFYVRLSMTTE